MKNRMVVTMTAWKRPEYTKRVLDSLIETRKPKPIYLIAAIEPGDVRVQKLFEDLPIECEVIVNSKQLGGPANAQQVMSRGFDLANRVVKLEDDTPIAYDALQYFQWGLSTFRNDESVYSICGYNRREKAVNESEKGKAYLLDWFTPWGWATWKPIFEELIEGWPQGKHGWDHYINREGRKGRYEVRPVLSRTQNIGARDGYNCKDPTFHKKKQYTPEWAGNYDKLLVKEWSVE